ncbi:hypothetical protein QOZ80_7AG0561500 [Eleusine coracana subsp. coracana]|nr:hypothetical protein QOZ80_7AG0561500 [Eleusine coracana subsp. coracana]
MTTTPTSSGGPQRRRRVLMFPLPFQGHINPMMQLAGVLHARGGLDITFFHAAFNAPDPARRPAGYRFVPVGEGVPSGDLLPSGGDRDFVAALLRINERLASPFRDLLKRELAADDAAACLVVDSNLRGMQLMAEELGLPTLVLRPGAAACLVAYMAFPALCEKGLLPPSTQDQSQLDKLLDEVPPLRLRDMMFSSATSHANMCKCIEYQMINMRHVQEVWKIGFELEGDAITGGRRRVLFFPLPFQGHINPMFQLAGLLHARGFAVTFFHTHFNAPDPSRHPDYDFVPVPGFDNASDEGNSSSDTVQVTLEKILAMNRSCEAPFRECLAALLLRSREEEDVACLVGDAHLLTLMDAARGLGVPTLVLRTGSAACFRLFMAFPMLCDKGYQPPQESQLEELVTELPPYRVRDLISTSAAGHGIIREVISRIMTAAESSSGLIINTFDALEADELASLRRDLPVPVFAVGPLHKLCPAASSSSLLQQDRGCLAWLDAQPPASVLYVSFGSLASVSASDLVETAWGIAGSVRPFLWVLRPGLVNDASYSQQLPDGFEAATRGRGVVVSWAPQEDVLAHPSVGVFWTHCGWNSTMEAACAGVPMLCRPCFGDQMGNARYVEHVWRIGVELNGELERGKVQTAIETLMGGDELRQRAKERRSRAAECVTETGSPSANVDKLVKHIMSLRRD